MAGAAASLGFAKPPPPFNLEMAIIEIIIVISIRYDYHY